MLDPATTKLTSILLLPIGANRRGGLKTLNSPAYAAFTSLKPLSLTRRPVPPVVNNTPRGDLALKKSPGKVSVLVNAAGTPSQLISRRPAGCSSRVAPLSGSPSRTRYCATAAAMAALSPLALTTCACPFFSRVFLAASGGAGAITRWPVSLQAAKSSAPSAAL